MSGPNTTHNPQWASGPGLTGSGEGTCKTPDVTYHLMIQRKRVYIEKR
jgi:hypothetical protein